MLSRLTLSDLRTPEICCKDKMREKPLQQLGGTTWNSNKNKIPDIAACLSETPSALETHESAPHAKYILESRLLNTGPY